MSDKKLTIAFSLDTPPYIMKKGTVGIELDILRAALEPAGYTFQVKQMPYGQLDLATKQGCDAATTVMQKPDGTFYSENYIGFHNFAISRASAQLTINTISDLKGKRIVAWENAYKGFGEEFEKLFEPKTLDLNYNEIADQREQVELFWKGEAQVCVIDEAVFRWFTRELSAEGVDTSAGLQLNKIFEPVTSFKISFVNEAARDAFNEGYSRLQMAGEIEKLYEKYT